MTSYETLLDRIISDGIAEVRVAYADPKEHHKRDGAIDGFEVCRGKQPAEIVELWKAAEKRANQIMHDPSDPLDAIAHRADRTDRTLEAYWKMRYAAMQIEFVCNVVSVGLVNSGLSPLLSHLPTARGAMKYAEICGVRSEGAEA